MFKLPRSLNQDDASLLLAIALSGLEFLGSAVEHNAGREALRTLLSYVHFRWLAAIEEINGRME